MMNYERAKALEDYRDALMYIVSFEGTRDPRYLQYHCAMDAASRLFGVGVTIEMYHAWIGLEEG